MKSPTSNTKTGVRTLFSHTEIFISATGFRTVGEWTRSLANPSPDFATRYRQAARRAAIRATSRVSGRSGYAVDQAMLEAESQIGIFLGTRVSRFPTLAKNLIARFTDGELPRSTRRALAFAARNAVDARLAQIAANASLPRFTAKARLAGLTAIPLRAEDCPVDTSADVWTFCAQIDALIAKAKEIAARSQSIGAIRAAAAHVVQLETWRADRLARPFAYRTL